MGPHVTKTKKTKKNSIHAAQGLFKECNKEPTTNVCSAFRDDESYMKEPWICVSGSGKDDRM